MAGPVLTPIAPRDHVVQFYDRAPELIERAGAYLSSAIAAGGTAIVVATRPHRKAFEQHLGRGGLDVPAAIGAGTLVFMDARQTLDRIVLHGRIEPAAFGALLRPVIARALEAGGPVHAYGEIVDLLWDAGEVEAAIELEAQWNDLGSTMPFSLYCSYRVSDAVPPGGRLAEVCRMHSALLDPPPGARPWPGHGVQVSRHFPANLWSPRDARHFVVETLRRWRLERLIDDAAVVVTEMCTNAVVHARSEFVIGIELAAEMVRVSVSDLSPLPPVDRVPGRLATSGRGLRLVSELSRRWGTDPGPAGKSVWAELGPSTFP